MNEVLKQRLVGALILVALGVIFWPIIFVQPEDELLQERNIPPQPNVSTERVDGPDSVGLRASTVIVADQDVARDEKSLAAATAREAEEEIDRTPVKTPVIVPQPPPRPEPQPEPQLKPQSKSQPKPEPQPARPAPEELKLDADGVPVAWILQVVSVSASEKAEGLRQRLDAMGHKAYVEKISSGGRTLYRVYIGPKFERGELDALKSTIDREFGVSSMTRRYVP